MRYAWFVLAVVALACAVFLGAFKVERICHWHGETVRAGFYAPGEHCSWHLTGR